VVRPIVALAVSGDHRVLDGHTLAAFVSDVAALIEDAGTLLGEDA
jgi:pyruvate/2-oxoglutarate dehydrogenase complex dihydrolipoamide acyltransferase (E2) component